MKRYEPCVHEMDNGGMMEVVKGNWVKYDDVRNMLDTLKAAIARVEIANAEGDPILSAWLPDAKAIVGKIEND